VQLQVCLPLLEPPRLRRRVLKELPQVVARFFYHT
jgi:hypothetical protein